MHFFFATIMQNHIGVDNATQPTSSSPKAPSPPDNAEPAIAKAYKTPPRVIGSPAAVATRTGAAGKRRISGNDRRGAPGHPQGRSAAEQPVGLTGAVQWEDRRRGSVNFREKSILLGGASTARKDRRQKEKRAGARAQRRRKMITRPSRPPQRRRSPQGESCRGPSAKPAGSVG